VCISWNKGNNRNNVRCNNKNTIGDTVRIRDQTVQKKLAWPWRWRH